MWFTCSYCAVEPIGARPCALTSGRCALRLGLRGGGDLDATDVELWYGIVSALTGGAGRTLLPFGAADLSGALKGLLN